MSSSSRKRRHRRESARYEHKRARQATNAVLRGDNASAILGDPWDGWGLLKVSQPPLVELNLPEKGGLSVHDEGKHPVAGNRCGNECGRRALAGDYLCARCRE